MIKISNKEWIKGIGLVLMFTLGWIASDLIGNLDCADCKTDKRVEQRMNRMQLGRKLEILPRFEEEEGVSRKYRGSGAKREKRNNREEK